MTQPWDNVEHSMASAPGANSDARIPSTPNQIAREAVSSDTMQNAASAPAHASLGLPASREQPRSHSETHLPKSDEGDARHAWPSAHRCGPAVTSLGGSSVNVTSAMYSVLSSRKLIWRFGGLLVLSSERMQAMFLASNLAYSTSPAVGRQSWFAAERIFCARA